jgi:hypothetical protein
MALVVITSGGLTVAAQPVNRPVASFHRASFSDMYLEATAARVLPWPDTYGLAFDAEQRCLLPIRGCMRWHGECQPHQPGSRLAASIPSADALWGARFAGVWAWHDEFRFP